MGQLGAPLSHTAPWEAFLPLGHGPTSCADERALRLLIAGRDWAAAVRCAEEALADDTCRHREECVGRALATLVYSGRLVAADEHGLPPLPAARVARLCGDAGRAHELLAGLIGSDAGRATRLVAVAWAVELLAERGDPAGARAMMARHDLDRVLACRPGLPAEHGARAMGARRDLDRAAGCRPVLLAARGAVAMAESRFPDALADYLACGRELIARGVRNPAVLPWRSEAALAACHAGRPGLAAALAWQEYAAAVAWGEPRTVGRALSAVAIVAGDGDVGLLAEAGELLELAQAWPELGTVCHELGVRLAARGDVVAARERLDRAAILARRTGDPERAARAVPALAGLAPPPRPALTRQQTRIARLVLAGYSNKEIAAKLFLALRTVEFHLSGTYDRLGISGRDELRTALA